MSNIRNEEILERLFEDALDELMASDMSHGMTNAAIEQAATDIAIERYNGMSEMDIEQEGEKYNDLTYSE
tara:strand:- start:7 stop:216 length:210 start_codon:yes stop_codon:yes gene_type:complete